MDIRVFENAVSHETCAELIEIFESSTKSVPSQLYGGLGGEEWRQGRVMVLNEGERHCRLAGVLIEAAQKHLQVLSVEHAGLKAMVEKGYALSCPRVERIGVGEGFDWHIDALQDVGDTRFLRFLFYLNDIDEGGETEFFFQPVSVRPKQGTLLTFAPYWTHVHRGANPISRTKFTAGLFALRV